MTAAHTPADAVPGLPGLEPLDVVYEAPGLPAWGLPRGLAAAYGGEVGFKRPCLYANFVASLDGVVALGPEYRSSGSAISQREPADRFVMGLLRALADAVLIGAGTLLRVPGVSVHPFRSIRYTGSGVSVHPFRGFPYTWRTGVGVALA
jgi:hypothetical protein